MKHKSAAAAMKCILAKVQALHDGGANIDEKIVHPDQRLYIETWVVPNIKKVLAMLEGDKVASREIQDWDSKGYFRL